MKPGLYLRKRRQAAGLDLNRVAADLARLPDALRSPLPVDIERLWARLAAAEADRDNLTLPQAWLLRRIFPFDVEVYEQLLLRHHGGPFSGLPLPKVCEACGCSWHDACVTPAGPCAWSTTHPALCSACEPAAPAPAPATATTASEGTAHGCC